MPWTSGSSASSVTAISARAFPDGACGKAEAWPEGGSLPVALGQGAMLTPAGAAGARQHFSRTCRCQSAAGCSHPWDACLHSKFTSELALLPCAARDSDKF